MTGGFLQDQLSNGLQINLKEIHTSPIISHWVWYRIGSRNEVPGFTGISHWVEHMQFKGTSRFPAGTLDKSISRTGGVWNAFTYLDWTTYYETLPAGQIDLAIQIESDRMVNSLFDPAEVESERSVILSELEGSQNEPTHRLGEAVQKAAFDQHPYRNEIIGSDQDLRNIQREDLIGHYRRFYSPHNAIITLAGDFKAEEMMKRLVPIYSQIPANGRVGTEILTEGTLGEERRVEVKGPGSTTYMQLAYRAPAASDPDFFAFSVLDSLLCGPTSLNMFGGGGISNKTSRLYRALVENELTVSIRGGLQATIDPFLFEIILTIRPDRSPQEALHAIDDQIHKLQDTLVSEEEIARAVKQARALFSYGSENITNQAFWLGYAEMFSHYDWFTGYLNSLSQIAPADVQRIAQAYLQPSRRVVGTYLPTGEEKPS
jgi:zinc protease